MNPDVLIINTNRGVQTGVAGYARLIQSMSGVRVVSTQRTDPRGIIMRVLTRLIRLGAVNHWYRVGSLKAEYSALKSIKHRVPDVVHIFWGDQDWGYIDLFLPSKTSLIISVHNPERLLEENFQRRDALRRVDRVILMSPDQAEFFVRWGVPAHRCVFVPHGIDTDVFSPSPYHCFALGGVLRVLHVGNYLRNFEHLAAVTRDLEGESIQFEIVCAPENRARHVFGDNVHWHHGISDSLLLALYRNCDLLLMTATGATANNAILEGISCGLPVVAQNVGGLRAYLDSSCAAFCDPTNWRELSDAIKALARDPERMKAKSTAARIKGEQFSWPRIAAQTMSVYKEAMNERIGAQSVCQ